MMPEPFDDQTDVEVSKLLEKLREEKQATRDSMDHLTKTLDQSNPDIRRTIRRIERKRSSSRPKKQDA